MHVCVMGSILCMSMCVRAFISVHIPRNNYTETSTHTYIHTHAHAHIYTYTHANAHTHTHMRTHTHTHTHAQANTAWACSAMAIGALSELEQGSDSLLFISLMIFY